MALSHIRTTWEDVSWPTKLVGGSILVGGLVYLLKHRGRKAGTGRKENPKDTVIVHHHLRGAHTPSITPFAVKLETYLRMANIPFETVIAWGRSKKGKIPWIEYNDESIADSEFCIQFLNKERGVNLNSHLTPEQEGVGRAFQKMLEENTYWILALDRWIFNENNDISVYYNAPWFLRRQVKNMVRNQTYNHGIGRHSKEEVYRILHLDLSALSKYLGTKKFLFGDRACQYDCAVFGIVSLGLWDGFGGQIPEIVKEYPNLCTYCENMKSEYWPDWDEFTMEGQKKKEKQ